MWDPLPQNPTGNRLSRADDRYRMDAYSPALIARGLTGMIGKGFRGEEVVSCMKSTERLFRRHRRRGALLGKCVRTSEVIVRRPGAEAIRKMEVVDFPVTVIIDSEGNNCTKPEEQPIWPAERIRRVIRGGGNAIGFRSRTIVGKVWILAHSFQIDQIYVRFINSRRQHKLQHPSSDLPRNAVAHRRRLADQLVANGTVKRAYDELEKEKLIEKSQGRGTFVSYLPESSDSRKVRAMAAIDQLFETLEELDFSMNEMGIFLNLKLQERARTQSNLRIAVVECNAEILSQLGEQLRKIEGVDIYPYLLDDIIAYPYKLGDDVDLIVTTQEHAQTLSAVVPDPHRIARIAVRPSTHCMSQIVKLKPSDRVGILCGSPRFGELLSGLCEIYTEGVDVSEPCLFSGEVDDYLADKTVVLVPENYDRWDEGKMSLSKRSCRLIVLYRIDEGSFIYLEEKVQRLRERRKL